MNKFFKKATLYNEDIDDILLRYRKEIDTLSAISNVWGKLTEKAKDVCMRDFDEVLILREIALEQIFKNKLNTHKTEIDLIDLKLLSNSNAVKNIFGFDVKSYLNV